MEPMPLLWGSKVGDSASPSSESQLLELMELELMSEVNPWLGRPLNCPFPKRSSESLPDMRPF